MAAILFMGQNVSFQSFRPEGPIVKAFFVDTFKVLTYLRSTQSDLGHVTKGFAWSAKMSPVGNALEYDDRCCKSLPVLPRYVVTMNIKWETICELSIPILTFYLR